jgi:hypothetical protein
MIEDYRWTTPEPLSTIQEVLDNYVREANMLDLVRRTSRFIEATDGRGNTFIIRAVSTGNLYSHRVTFEKVDS